MTPWRRTLQAFIADYIDSTHLRLMNVIILLGFRAIRGHGCAAFPDGAYNVEGIVDQVLWR